MSASSHPVARPNAPTANAVYLALLTWAFTFYNSVRVLS